MPSEKKKLSDHLREHIADDGLADVTLVGNDGGTVPAFRCILAVRSEVFRRMLFGNFKEASSEKLTVQFRTSSLQALVEYSYTDEITQFESNLRASGSVDEEGARSVVDLLAAAHFFNLSCLADVARDLARSIISDDLSLACPILDECARVGEIADSLGAEALELIRLKPRPSLLPADASAGRGIQALSPELLARVVEDNGMTTDELTLFQCIQAWADVGIKKEDGRQGKKRKIADSTEDRRSVVDRCVRSIDLSRIAPSALCNVVKKSGLVKSSQLSAAFEAQALTLERKCSSMFTEVRTKPLGGGVTFVQGSGLSVVNGFFVGTPSSNGAHTFGKVGILENKERKFTLAKTRYNDSGRGYNNLVAQWEISVEKDSSADEVLLYRSVEIRGKKAKWNFPPELLWRTVQGVDPPPAVVWKNVGDNDDVDLSSSDAESESDADSSDSE